MKTQIIKLQTTNTEDRTIRTVHFEVHSEGQKQYAKVDLPDADESSFIPFEDITEETIVNWISGTDDYKRSIEVLENKIAKRKNLDEPQLPWIKVNEDEEIE